MAISKNGENNPTSVIYNGKNVNQVWYKSSPTAEPIWVWPDPPQPGNSVLCCATTGVAKGKYLTIYPNYTTSKDYMLYTFKDSGGYTKGNVYDLDYRISNNSKIEIPNVLWQRPQMESASYTYSIQFVIDRSWTLIQYIFETSNSSAISLSCKNNHVYISGGGVTNYDVTSLFTERGFTGDLTQYKWYRVYLQRQGFKADHTTIGGDIIVYFDSTDAPSWITD